MATAVSASSSKLSLPSSPLPLGNRSSSVAAFQKPPFATSLRWTTQNNASAYLLRPNSRRAVSCSLNASEETPADTFQAFSDALRRTVVAAACIAAMSGIPTLPAAAESLQACASMDSYCASSRGLTGSAFRTEPHDVVNNYQVHTNAQVGNSFGLQAVALAAPATPATTAPPATTSPATTSPATTPPATTSTATSPPATATAPPTNATGPAAPATSPAPSGTPAATTTTPSQAAPGAGSAQGEAKGNPEATSPAALAKAKTVQFPGPLPAWLNELHYDNIGKDENEFVEVITRPGVNPDDITVLLYNGSDGKVYGSYSLSKFTPGSKIAGFATYSLTFPSNGIQNGPADGVAIVQKTAGVEKVVQFVSYEGVLVALEGPAKGFKSVDIGVSQNDKTPKGSSLGLGGKGKDYGEFKWGVIDKASPGKVNPGQSVSI